MSAPRPLALAAMAALGAWLSAASLPALAQYKVVGPDGSVTYTDRPPAASAGAKVNPMRAGTATPNSGNAAATPAAGSTPDLSRLPAPLRAAATRFPVTLYTGSDCEPCNRGRELLRQRGVPFAERSISSEADTLALQRLSGARTVPTLAVGQQMLRGLLDSQWQSTLDLAGYPASSALPAGWVPPAVQPLVPPAAPAAEAERPAPARSPAPAEAPPAASSGIRF